LKDGKEVNAVMLVGRLFHARINKVTQCWTQLVLGWVTVSGVQLPVQKSLSQYITGHHQEKTVSSV